MSYVRSEYFEGAISRDFFDAVCGDKLGHGIGRHVHAMLLDPTCVVKFEVSSYSFQNAHEWEFWDEVKETKLAPWFAPCVRISPCGLVLVQKRTQPIPVGYDMPKEVPSCITDLKLENFGLYEGRVVCHDYGRLSVVSSGWKGINRMKTAKWWSLADDKIKGGAGVAAAAE